MRPFANSWYTPEATGFSADVAAPSQLLTPPSEAYKVPIAPDTPDAAAAWISILADRWRREADESVDEAAPDGVVLALGEVGVAEVVMHDEAPLVVAAVVLEAWELGVSVAVVLGDAVLVLALGEVMLDAVVLDGVVLALGDAVLVLALGDAVLVLALGEVVLDGVVLGDAVLVLGDAVLVLGDAVLVLDEEGELVVVTHDGDPVVVAAVVLVLGEVVLDGVVLGEVVLAPDGLEVLPAVEMLVSCVGAPDEGTDGVAVEDGVEGAPNALAVGMSTSVSDAADTPSSRCVPVRACDMFVLHCPDFTARRAVAHVCRRKDGAQTCADCQVKTSTHG